MSGTGHPCPSVVSEQIQVYLDSTYPPVVLCPMSVRRSAFLPPSPSFVFNKFQIPHPQRLLSRFSFQQLTNRSLAHLDSYTPSFQELTNPYFRKPFVLTTIRIAGGGGVSVLCSLLTFHVLTSQRSTFLHHKARLFIYLQPLWKKRAGWGMTRAAELRYTHGDSLPRSSHV